MSSALDWKRRCSVHHVSAVLDAFEPCPSTRQKGLHACDGLEEDDALQPFVLCHVGAVAGHLVKAPACQAHGPVARLLVPLRSQMMMELFTVMIS